MIKVWCFYRRSTDRQELSVQDQSKACQSKAEEMRWVVVREFIPHKGYASGLTIEKDDTFQEMVRILESTDHGIKYLLVYDVSRFGRLPVSRKFYWEERFRDRGVEIVYVSENFKNDGSIEDGLHRHIAHAEAHDYSIKLSRDTIRGAKSHAALGHSTGGRPPYGYDRLLIDQHGNSVKVLKDGEHKADKLQHIVWAVGDPGKVELVKWLFESFNLGKSLIALVNDLNQRQILSPYGTSWGKCSVRSMLQNPSYIGTRIYFKHSYHSRSPKPRKSIRCKEEWIIKENAHPSIISKYIFDKAQSRFKPTGRRTAGHYDSPHCFSGMIYCARCGHSYCGRYRHYDGRKIPYYDCVGYHSKGTYVCKSFSIKSELLENFAAKKIMAQIPNLINSEKIRYALYSTTKQLASANNTSMLGELEKSITGHQKQINNIINAIKDGKGSDTLFQELERLEMKKKEIELMRDKSKANIPIKKININAAVEEMMQYLKEFPETISLGTVAERRVALRYFIQRIDILPDVREARFSFYKNPALKEEIVPETNRNDLFQSGGCGGWI